MQPVWIPNKWPEPCSWYLVPKRLLKFSLSKFLREGNEKTDPRKAWQKNSTKDKLIAKLLSTVNRAELPQEEDTACCGRYLLSKDPDL